MASEVWLPLGQSERTLLRIALAAYAREGNREEATALSRKLASAAPYPDITVGVYGGQVQWTMGNPFPLRIVDYDGDKEDLPDADDNGEPCRMWFEPSDAEREASLRKRSA
jgi:hypothetical protein